MIYVDNRAEKMNISEEEIKELNREAIEELKKVWEYDI